jgi:mono/diheme cytochrome c family protein
MTLRLANWLFILFCSPAFALTITPEQLAQLPPPADHKIDFSKEIKPIFEASCVKCHGRGKDKGGLRIDTRETLLKGGDSGLVVVPGKSADSLLISLVQGFDPDSVMPKKGSRLTPEQIGLLRAWIDQGADWDPHITFARPPAANLKPHLPDIPPGPENDNPIDRFLQPYFASHNVQPPPPVSDRIFARRAYLDVTGLLPPPKVLEAFVSNKQVNKRGQLIKDLLADNRAYAENWLTFWNDLLRNDYRGTGYIDGGRKQITAWLYSALQTNMPFNQFVSQLISPVTNSEGFTKGIVWRGVVNASQTPQMQAAQNISQVFMGVNLKCASCHDSFVNDFTLADSYGLASIYADGPLEMVRCDKPTGQKAALKFIYPELGAISSDADKPTRLKQLAEIITKRDDGRLTRTLVNRIWQRLMGRGLVEPVDEMEKTAWNQDLLDWLAEDFSAHDYDVKFLLQRILSSRAYQLPAVNLGEQTDQNFVFHGPAVRRLSAEQFRDALTSITGIGYPSPLADVVSVEPEQKRFALAVPISWIWNTTNAAEKAKAGHVYFRKTVKLAAVPEQATAVMTADNTFTFYVNGKEVGTGNDFKTGYLFNLRPFLKPGENLFVVDAVNNLSGNIPPTSGEDPPPGSESPAGLLFYARLRHFDHGVQKTNDVASDETWQCSSTVQTPWQNPDQPGRASPPAVPFPATDWTHASKLGDPGMIPWRITKIYLTTRIASVYPGKTRASLVAADPLMTALGRPNREQVVTVRSSVATTLQALEMTNGETLADILKRGADNLLNDPAMAKKSLIPTLYERALGRKPTAPELELAQNIVGKPVQPAGVEDLLWSLTMLPEFQLIY